MAAGLLVTALVATGCEAKPHRADARSIGHGVTLAGSASPAQATANVATKVHPDIPNTVALSDTFDIAPSGKLSGPITVTVPMTSPASPDQGVVVATSESAQGPWDLLAGTVSSDGRSVSFTTTHFSLFGILGTNLKDLWNQFRQEFIDPLTGSALAEATPPTCANENAARSDGYSISSDSGSTVYWCLGVSESKRILRVVNNRRYPLEVAHPGLPVDAGAAIHADQWAQLSRAISGDLAIIAPRDSATFQVALAPGGQTTLSTQFDGLGQSLYALQTGIQALVNILTRFGKGSGQMVTEMVSAALQLEQCVGALKSGPAAVLNGCFSPEELWRALGAKALLVIPLMVYGPLIEFFHSEFNALGDQFNHRDRYKVTISHANGPSTPPAGGPTPPNSGTGGNPPPSGAGGNTVPPTNPSIALAQGPTATAGYRYAVTLQRFAPNSNVTITCHDSVDPGGFYSFTLHTDGAGNAFTQSYCYSADGPDHWARANGVESNHVTW